MVAVELQQVIGGWIMRTIVNDEELLMGEPLSYLGVSLVSSIGAL